MLAYTIYERNRQIVKEVIFYIWQDTVKVDYKPKIHFIMFK